jgi:hypothetical protein
MTGARVGGWERRSWKNLLIAVVGVVQTVCRETTAAGCSNRDGGGKEECRVMLTDGLETGNSWAF